MNDLILAPMLTEKDPVESSEGGIDPLGTEPLADSLAGKLIPGVRERQRHPRFLTAMAVSLEICSEFDEEFLAKDGVSEPWQIFEWYLVEGLVRTTNHDERVGLPGSQKAEKALRDNVPLSARRYLKSPRISGFHGVYRQLARTLGIEEEGFLGEYGYELLNVWTKEQNLDGFIGTINGSGSEERKRILDAINDGMKNGATARSASWSGWEFFHKHLALYIAGLKESRFLFNLLRNDLRGFRGKVIDFLISPEGGKIRESNFSERDFHQALRIYAQEDLALLIDAIDAYETFCRLCQDAFDECLFEMTLNRGKKTSPSMLSMLKSVKKAAHAIPDLFIEIMERLEPVGELARFRDTFTAFAEPCNPVEWVERLVEHHLKIQRQKPPNGKNPWFERFDDGSLIIRPEYRTDKSGAYDKSYVHF